MYFAKSAEAVKDRIRKKGTVVKSPVVPRRPRKIKRQSKLDCMIPYNACSVTFLVDCTGPGLLTKVFYDFKFIERT